MMTQGGFGYQTLLHETGHALGLKHPGEYNSAATATSDLSKLGPFAPAGWDNTEYTIMSYVTNQYALSTNKSSYSTLDIAALQSFYGAPTKASVTTFTLSDFGRTLQPASGGGSDHAWGSHHFVLGGAVRGGAAD